MSISHAKSGQLISLSLGAELGAAKTITLAKTKDMEVIRLIIPAGKEIPAHSVPGEITVQCLEGRVLFTSHGKGQELAAGQFLYLSGAEQHALKGIEDSSVLVTILSNQKPPK